MAVDDQVEPRIFKRQAVAGKRLEHLNAQRLQPCPGQWNAGAIPLCGTRVGWQGAQRREELSAAGPHVQHGARLPEVAEDPLAVGPRRGALPPATVHEREVPAAELLPLSLRDQ